MRERQIVSVKENRNVITYFNERKDNPNVYLKSYKLYSLHDIKEGGELFLKYWYTQKYNILKR